METKGERTRKVLLAVAMDRFARDGYRLTSMTDIARDSGLSSTAAYAYFPNKEALFLAAVDEDTATYIAAALTQVLGGRWDGDWHRLIGGLVSGLADHRLTRRVLAGLEPEFSVRLLGMPALEELRKGLGELMVAEQATGLTRADVDARQIASGVVTIVISILITLVQTGADPTGSLGDDVVAVLEASLHPPGKPRRIRGGGSPR